MRLPDALIDFCSNDYLGIVKNDLLQQHEIFKQKLKTGSGGSRLLAGNYVLAEETEKEIAAFHNAEAALVFNSGYAANTGVLSCVPQRGDIILYDYLSHASIRDGIRLSFAQPFSFAHNDMADLEKKLQSNKGKNIFIVTESVFSMDGDLAPLPQLLALCEQYGAWLVVDDARWRRTPLRRCRRDRRGLSALPHLRASSQPLRAPVGQASRRTHRAATSGSHTLCLGGERVASDDECVLDSCRRRGHSC